MIGRGDSSSLSIPDSRFGSLILRLGLSTFLEFSNGFLLSRLAVRSRVREDETMIIDRVYIASVFSKRNNERAFSSFLSFRSLSRSRSFVDPFASYRSTRSNHLSFLQLSRTLERTCVRLQQVTHLTRTRACHFTCLIDRREKSHGAVAIAHSDTRLVADFSYSGNERSLTRASSLACSAETRPIVVRLVSPVVSRYS